MLVSYEPNYFSGEFPYGHFEFRSPRKPPRRIPVSETGYRSHFAPMAEIKAAPSPEDYARSVALALIGREPSDAGNEDSSGQLALF
jgi:hypothetical protein